MIDTTRTIITGNLRWTQTGTVWADFLLTGLPYGLRPTKDKHDVRKIHQALFRDLQGESLLLGINATADPAEIVHQMLSGVDAAARPQWMAECEATLESLSDIMLGQRVFWLSVPLPHSKDTVKSLSRTALHDIHHLLGLPLAMPGREEISRAHQQAKTIMDAIPAPFEAAAATPAQMVWLHHHMLRRGLFEDIEMPRRPDDLATELLVPKTGTALTQPVFDEGALSDPGTSRSDLLKRRVLKITDPDSLNATEPSYQALLVLSDTPDGEIEFPGGELLGRIDESGVPIDWAMRITAAPREETTLRNQRALRNINNQFYERENDTSRTLDGLGQSAATLADYTDLLEREKLECEMQVTVILACAATTAEDTAIQAKAIAGFCSDADYRLDCPLGYQESLWWAMVPGTAATAAVREFTQITTSSMLAALTPLASTQLGDQRGSALGINIAHGPMLDARTPCGPASVVLHDPEGASDADREISGSLAVAGEPGAGKTATLKKLAGDVIDRGGQLVIADRTEAGEWVPWAQAMTDHTVVDTHSPQASLDPLRVFPGRTGARVLSNFLTPLLNIPASSDLGAALSEATDEAYLDQWGINSTGDLVAHLSSTSCAIPGSADLVRKIAVFGRHDFGAIVFDPAVPPLQLTSSALVVRTNNLPLPSKEELENQHLFEQMPLDKLFGRALNALVASLARHICFADSSRMSGFVVSEAHAMTVSFEGERELVDFVRDGRKHRAVTFLDSHDPLADFGSKTLRGLIPNRLLMRHRDHELARAGLQWLDLDPDDEQLVRLITSDTSPIGPNGVPEHRRGEGIMRDLAGNLGRIKIMLPARRERRAAITAGGSARARHQPEGAA